MNLFNIILIIIFFGFQGVVFSQHYDTGFKTQYVGIEKENAVNGKLKEWVLTINAEKKIKKIFNTDGSLREDLVFINDVMTSGIEYFENESFPFLKSPRKFQVKEIEKNIINYENVKFSESLIKYLPQVKRGVFKVRVYSNQGKAFYILKIGGENKLYFE